MCRQLFFLCFVILISGCVSPQRKTAAPQFPSTTRQRVEIRLDDRRPAAQTGGVRDAEYLYYRPRGLSHVESTLQYLGNALTAFQAAPGYQVVGPASDPEDAEVFIDLIYVEGYARWPNKVNRRLQHVPVEGKAHLTYSVYVEGKRVKKGTMKEEPPVLKVPVGIVNRSNVAKIVNESMAHQFDKATTKMLEDFLWELADVWPESSAR